MKKTILFCVSLCVGLLLSGCAVSDRLQEYLPTSPTETPSVTADPAERTYMDEISGTLLLFDGSSVTLTAEDVQYTFDVSQSTLETAQGMITGDEINIIYEGRMSPTDPEDVHALKVVDDIHKKNMLQEQTVHGIVKRITANVLTMQTDDGQTINWPITGTSQYYASGIHVDSAVYLRYKGNLIPSSEEGGSPNANHVKVLSVSDQDAWNAQNPTVAPKNAKKFRGYITSFHNNVVRVRPTGSTAVLTIDLTSVPSWLDGGFAWHSGINVYYDGTFQKDTLDGITVTAVAGDSFDTFPTRKIASVVSGVIIGSTADTISLRTDDDTFVTCTTSGLADGSAVDLSIGSSVTVVFDPNASRTTNVYTSLSIKAN